jgi:predicted component of type VI protein secretion system
MGKTLLEKLDSRAEHISLRESVLNQVQRIISSRTFPGHSPEHPSYVTGFGVPEIVDQYATNSDDHGRYRGIIRRQILELEPRLTDVEVKSIESHTDRASCQLVLQMEQVSVEEQFFF